MYSTEIIHKVVNTIAGPCHPVFVVDDGPTAGRTERAKYTIGDIAPRYPVPALQTDVFVGRSVAVIVTHTGTVRETRACSIFHRDSPHVLRWSR